MARLTASDSKKRAARELANGVRPGDYSEALERGLMVLKAFSTENPRMTQADLARTLNLPRATVRRAVVTLVHLGYLVPDGRTYALSPQVLQLSTTYLTSNSISLVVQPVCDQICADLEASCTVAILDRHDAVMIARALPNQAITIGSGVGYRVPAATSALGKVLLAELDSVELKRFLAEAPQTAKAKASDVSRIEASIADVPKSGYSYVANEVEPGYHSVAVPLRRWDGNVIAALNVGSNIERITPSRMTSSVLAQLKDAANTLRDQLV